MKKKKGAVDVNILLYIGKSYLYNTYTIISKTFEHSLTIMTGKYHRYSIFYSLNTIQEGSLKVVNGFSINSTYRTEHLNISERQSFQNN